MIQYLKNIKLDNNIINQIVKKFNDDLNDLKTSLIKNNHNNCFYINDDIIFKGLNKTFYDDIIKNLNNEYDLISLLNFNLNKKIRYDYNNNINIIGFNIKPYILCDNMINCNCSISKKCYASKNEYQKNNNIYHSLLNSLKNYVFYYYCIYSNKTNKYLNLALFKNIALIKKFNVIRYNIKSDIIDNKHLKFLNDMFLILKKHYNFKYAYTYTKTKNLDFNIIDKKFIINQSIIINDLDDVKNFNKSDLKQCFITINNKDIKINQLNNVIECKNYTNKTNCNMCIQCLNTKNKCTYIH